MLPSVTSVCMARSVLPLLGFLPAMLPGKSLLSGPQLKPLADSLLPFVAMAGLRPRLANTMFAITFVLSPGAAGEHDVRNHLRLFSRVPGRCPGL